MNNKDEMLRPGRDEERKNVGATIYRLPYAEAEQTEKKRKRSVLRFRGHAG